MKIVITGALGHIGSYVCRDFAAKFVDSEIILIDNISTQRYSSLFNLPKNVNYRFIEGDVLEIDLDKILQNSDIVIHLAAICDAANSFDNAKAVEENNFNSTRKIANACLRQNVKLIVLSSTSVYGTQDKLVSEDCNKEDLKPQSPYASTKLLEEELIGNMCSNDGLNAVCFRFGTIMGISQGMRFQTAVNKFCWQSVMGQEITVWTTAYNQVRPYLDIRDASNLFSFIISKDVFDGRIYNALTEHATVKNIIDIIKKYVLDVKISYVDSKIMNQYSYEVSTERIKKLGYNFTGSLEKSILDTINLLKKSNIYCK